jgi:hypothetical protein
MKTYNVIVTYENGEFTTKIMNADNKMKIYSNIFSDPELQMSKSTSIQILEIVEETEGDREQ